MSDFWNKRYAEPGLAYGEAPNEFLAAVAKQIPPGTVLTIGEGEGRNAILLASLGYEVLAIDQSQVGLAKLRQRAAEKGLSIKTLQADLAEYKIEPDQWSAIVSIFCHLPPAIRMPLHRAIVTGLKPGGLFVLEAYTPAQLAKKTGGPTDVKMLLTLDDLKNELPGLEFIQAKELDRPVNEGAYHNGVASVVQLVARRPG